MINVLPAQTNEPPAEGEGEANRSSNENQKNVRSLDIL